MHFVWGVTRRLRSLCLTLATDSNNHNACSMPIRGGGRGGRALLREATGAGAPHHHGNGGVVPQPPPPLADRAAPAAAGGSALLDGGGSAIPSHYSALLGGGGGGGGHGGPLSSALALAGGIGSGVGASALRNIRGSGSVRTAKPAAAYTGLTGAGYTLSGQPGRFLLPEQPVSSSRDTAGALDVWPAGKSQSHASVAMQHRQKKTRRRRRAGDNSLPNGFAASNLRPSGGGGGGSGRGGGRGGIGMPSGGGGGGGSDFRHDGSASSAMAPPETNSKPKLLQELEAFVQAELAVLGCDQTAILVGANARNGAGGSGESGGGGGSEPSAARLQVYREAFRHFMDEFRTYKPFLSAVKNEYDSVLDKYARRLHYIPALRARLSTMEAGTKQRLRREAESHQAEIRHIKVSTRAAADRVKELEKLNAKLIDDNVKITRELDLQRTHYLDMKTANVSIVASLKKKDIIINATGGDKQKQEDRARQLAAQLEQLEIKHDVVLIQLANLRAAHIKATEAGSVANAERLEHELAAARKEQAATLEEHRALGEQHSKTLTMLETASRQAREATEALEALKKERDEGGWVRAPSSGKGHHGKHHHHPHAKHSKGHPNSDGSSHAHTIEGVTLGKKAGAKARRDLRAGGTGRAGSRGGGTPVDGERPGTPPHLQPGSPDLVHSAVGYEVWEEWLRRARACGILLGEQFELHGPKAEARVKKEHTDKGAVLTSAVEAGALPPAPASEDTDTGGDNKKHHGDHKKHHGDKKHHSDKKGGHHQKSSGGHHGGKKGHGAHHKGHHPKGHHHHHHQKDPAKRTGGIDHTVFVAQLVESALNMLALEKDVDAREEWGGGVGVNEDGEQADGGVALDQAPPQPRFFSSGSYRLSIKDLRKLADKKPAWQRPVAGAGGLSDQALGAKATTGKETGITEIAMENKVDGTKYKAGSGKSSAGQQRGMAYFIGRGIGPEVPVFLRFNGRIRNHYTTKPTVERIVKTVWMRKEQSRNKERLAIFFHGWLNDTYGPSPTLVVEQAYNIVHALEKFSYDADCDMFLKILMGELPEQAFVDQQLLIRQLQVCLSLLGFLVVGVWGSFPIWNVLD